MVYSDMVLLGLFGMSVRCIKPTVSHPTEPVCSWPAPGDLGRVVGIIQGKVDLEILVLMDDACEDFESIPYAKFGECFSPDNTRRRFKMILGS